MDMNVEVPFHGTISEELTAMNNNVGLILAMHRTRQANQGEFNNQLLQLLQTDIWKGKRKFEDVEFDCGKIGILPLT
ncbi:hypothetical protein RJT34_08284 [Clitoria ternatea]|uniref:Uncharacterized protein n=1 Tax=Clitoria ternatea TaxID=43366 RepID=A0AAN9PUS0_CLITE